VKQNSRTFTEPACSANYSERYTCMNETLHDQEKEQQAIQERMAHIKHTLLVLSGKGGVGKSTVAVNIAAALAKEGGRVGLMDVDIHGPSIPGMLGLDGYQAFYTGSAIMPIEFTGNMLVMSIGFLLQDRKDAVIWRGPMKYHVIRQFISDVEWGELDYLVVDCPPGTGDEPLSVAQFVGGNHAGAVLVTTPQRVSVDDVRKSVQFCRKLEMDVFGVIENMSGFVCPECGATIDIFDTGGGKKLAEEMQAPFLGSIPVEPEVVKSSDAGVPIILGSGESTAAQRFLEISDKIRSAFAS